MSSRPNSDSQGTIANVVGNDLLVIEGLSKRFGGLKAVDNFSLTLRGGEIVGLIGPNGCGKTTLINLVTGVLRADSGKVALQGKPLRLGSVSTVARSGVVRLFQEPRVFESLTGLASLAVARGRGYASGHSRAAAGGPPDPDAAMKAISARLVEEANLSNVLNDLTSIYSFGQRRLLGMAAVIETGASVLLVDEPTAGLSVRLLPTLGRVLQHLAATGRAVLVVEHNFGFLLEWCSHCAVMKAGQLVALGKAREILQPEIFQQYFLR